MKKVPFEVIRPIKSGNSRTSCLYTSRIVQLSATEKFANNKFLQCLVVFFIVFWAVLAISPGDRFDWILENLLTFISLGVLVATFRFFQFSNTSYLLITTFFSLHTYGAHYAYIVPISGWLQDTFDFSRNHYDRVVHFCFGLLLTFPIMELIHRVGKLNNILSYSVAVSVVLAAGAFYEVIEMYVARIATPKLGIAFLGVQGDVWDTQTDMAVAFYGSLLAICVGVLYRRLFPKKM